MTDLLVIENFINGKFTSTAEYIDSYDPSTGAVYARVPNSSAEDVAKAVTAAQHAFELWSQKSPSCRSSVMRAIADLIEENADSLASAESRDQGKPVALARMVDIPRCVHNFRFFANTILCETDVSTRQHEPISALNYVHREPMGVAGLISPWNLPLYLLTFKIAPAIAVGNTVVAKPSELTSVTAWMLAKLMNQAGLPAGVVNFVFGRGQPAGEAIVRHPDIPLLSFTGSTLIGTRIASLSGASAKKLSLEMGGKNCAVVCEDADVDLAVRTSLRSSFANQGEICLCTSRIFVHDSIFDSFVSKFVEGAKTLNVCDPAVGAASDLGALVSAEHLAKVKSYVQLARDGEAKILCGDEPMSLPSHCSNGYFLRPHVLTDVSNESRLMQEEIFGPVTCVVPFSSEEDVLVRANSVNYGLCAVVYSKDLKSCHRIASKLKVGTVWINCWLVRDLRVPFGGTKASGIGREGMHESIEFYTEQKTVCVALE